ncbi:putative F-box protein At1g33530 [Typha angustifolia]|uniref:putative F-box protein At1g33530 n=1 Tax=Typha angustifolia TaxID=59011 RepID=UPI003C2E87B7
MRSSISPHLPDDLVYCDILPLLPAKVLLRFQCVSQSWCQVIRKESYFSYLQYLHARPHALLLVDEMHRPTLISRDPISVGFPSLSSQFLDKQVTVIASCNGIVCIVIRGFDLAYVGNPVLKLWRLLPRPKVHTITLEFSVGLAVFATESSVSYKLVHPFYILGTDACGYEEVGFEVFSSERRTWEVSKEKLLMKRAAVGGPYAYVDEIMFWAGSDQLLWFDPKEERSGTFPLPSDVSRAGYFLIGEWNSRLSIALIAGCEIQIWCWNQSSWSKLWSPTLEEITQQIELFSPIRDLIDLPNLEIGPLDVCFQQRLVRFCSFGVDYFILEVTGILHCYDTRTGKAWKLKCRPPPQPPFISFTYTNTLVMPPDLLLI